MKTYHSFLIFNFFVSDSLNNLLIAFNFQITIVMHKLNNRIINYRDINNRLTKDICIYFLHLTFLFYRNFLSSKTCFFLEQMHIHIFHYIFDFLKHSNFLYLPNLIIIVIIIIIIIN